MDLSKLDMSAVGPLAAILLGAAAFLIICGIGVLDPRNILWLDSGDPATMWLGASIFVESPWTWPPGANPRYGLEFASGIFASDSIPLLAFGAKMLTPLVWSGALQYFGLWLFVCFCLQALFGYALARSVGLPSLTALLFSGLCIFFPAFLWRLEGHYALAGQWLILASTALYFSETHQRLRLRMVAWVGIVLIAALVHAYLLAMVLAVFVAALVKTGISLRWEGRFLLVARGALGLVCAAIGLWLSGVSELGGGMGSGGFGLYRMNLASLVDSSGWSYFLRDVPEAEGDYEGLVFLGIGALLLLLVVLAAPTEGGTRTLPLRPWLPLAVAAVALLLFAVSNRVAVGAVELAEVPLPNILIRLASVFRSSGRFAWLFAYLVVLAAVALAYVRLGSRRGNVVIFIALCIQALDTSSGWWRFGAKFARSGDAWPSTLSSPQWQAMARSAAEVRIIPPENHTKHWREFAYFAARNGLATNAVYLARVDPSSVALAQAHAERVVRFGAFVPGEIYVFDGEAPARVGAGTATSEWIARVDDFNVAFRPLRAMEAASVAQREAVAASHGANETGTGVALPFNAVFAAGEAGERLLASGWWAAEAWGVWSGSGGGTLIIPSEVLRLAKSLSFTFSAFARPGQSRRVNVLLDGEPLGDLELGRQQRTAEFLLPRGAVLDNSSMSSRLELRLDGRRLTPASLGESADRRPLGIGLVRIEVR